MGYTGGMNPSSLPHRRSFLSQLASTSLVFGASASSVLHSRVAYGTPWPAPQDKGLQPLNRFSRMTQEWLVDQVRLAEAEGNRLRAQVHSPEDAAKYVASCRERAKECFGPLPEKTPLHAKVTKVTERDTYRIENVIFQSRPGFWVTANLYVPKDRKGKAPGVVGTCGHSANGKAAEAYQYFAQGLARLGYISLIFDPIGQGERLQYSAPGRKSKWSSGVSEHIQMGNQQSLVGEFLGTWFAWDGIRALDYLLSREEVDPNHVGVTGNSGGGTQTTWLTALESRWTMAAPACFITTFRRNAENELPADTEQCPPKALSLRMDHSDFLACLAPKPMVILAQEKDFFDVRGAEEAYDRLKKLYSAFGKPDNLQLVIGPNYHGFSKENRESMYRFFNLQTKLETRDVESQLILEKDETLWCTPRGSIADLESKTVFSFTRDIAQTQKQARGKPTTTELPERIKTTLKVVLPSSDPDYRILRSVGNRSYPAKFYTTYAIDTEPGIQAIVSMLSDISWMSRPRKDRADAILYISHRSSDRELREDSWLREKIHSMGNTAFFACDVRGIGDSQPDTCGANQFDNPYGSDYFGASHGLMLDRPVLGQRVTDCLVAIRWLESMGVKGVHLMGCGWGAIVASLAGVLSSSVTRVTLKNALASFQSVAETEDYEWPYAMLPHGILSKFDLPDCYEALTSKGLEQVSPWEARDGKG
jgi:cephalosporin-C deacetylase-like acetyl esterase